MDPERGWLSCCRIRYRHALFRFCDECARVARFRDHRVHAMVPFDSVDRSEGLVQEAQSARAGMNGAPSVNGDAPLRRPEYESGRLSGMIALSTSSLCAPAGTGIDLSPLEGVADLGAWLRAGRGVA